MPGGVEFYPEVVPAPAAFHLGDVEETVTLGADQFGTVPVEEVAGGEADAGGAAEHAEAVLAAVLLVEKSPAQAEDDGQGG